MATHELRWTEEQRAQMRKRMSDEVNWLRDSPQASLVLNQIAHRGPGQAIRDCIRVGNPARIEESIIGAHEVVESVCRAACDIVLSQLIEGDPGRIDYNLTDHALGEQLSCFRASQRKKSEDNDADSR